MFCLAFVATPFLTFKTSRSPVVALPKIERARHVSQHLVERTGYVAHRLRNLLAKRVVCAKLLDVAAGQHVLRLGNQRLQIVVVKDVPRLERLDEPQDVLDG